MRKKARCTSIQPKMWYINWFWKIVTEQQQNVQLHARNERATKRKVNWSFSHLTGKLVFFRLFHSFNSQIYIHTHIYTLPHSFEYISIQNSHSICRLDPIQIDWHANGLWNSLFDSFLSFLLQRKKKKINKKTKTITTGFKLIMCNKSKQNKPI